MHAGLEDGQAPGRTAPFDDLNVHLARAPSVHRVFAGLVEVDGLGPDQGRPVVVNFIKVLVAFDFEDGPDGIDRPVGGCAADGAIAQCAACGRGRAVFQVVAFGMRVGGGFHVRDAWHRAGGDACAGCGTR